VSRFGGNAKMLFQIARGGLGERFTELGKGLSTELALRGAVESSYTSKLLNGRDFIAVEI